MDGVNRFCNAAVSFNRCSMFYAWKMYCQLHTVSIHQALSPEPRRGSAPALLLPWGSNHKLPRPSVPTLPKTLATLLRNYRGISATAILPVSCIVLVIFCYKILISYRYKNRYPSLTTSDTSWTDVKLIVMYLEHTGILSTLGTKATMHLLHKFG